jgi:hypothetical protein
MAGVGHRLTGIVELSKQESGNCHFALHLYNAPKDFGTYHQF